MKYLKVCIYTILLSFQLVSANEINGEELKKISNRSVQLMGFIQSRCVTVMQKGTFRELSGVIVSKNGYIFSSYIRSTENEIYIIYLPDGRRVTAKLLDSDIRKGISLLKIEQGENWPEVELADLEVEPNSWGLIGGFGLERMRSQSAQIKLTRILKFTDENKRHLISFGSCLQSDLGGPVFDLDGRLLGIVSAVGTNQYQTKITHINEFSDLDSDLIDKLKNTRLSFYNNFDSLKKLTVNKPAADLEEVVPKNIGLLQEYLAEFTKSKIPGIAQVKCNNSPSILGSVISSDGYILTKATEVGSNLTVEIEGNIYPAILYAEDSEFDLALIKIEAKNLTCIEWSSYTPGSFIFSPTQNSEEMGFGIIGHESLKFSKDFFNINSPDKNSSLRTVLEHGSNDYRIAAFLPESTLQKAGAEIGDTIVEVNGQKTPLREDVLKEISKLNPGDEISVKIKDKNDISKHLNCLLSEAQKKEYPTSDREYLITDISYRRSGFPKVFIHDSIMEAWQCGAPVFDLEGRAVGINIARHNRTSTLAIPAEEIAKSISNMMKKSIKF